MHRLSIIAVLTVGVVLGAPLSPNLELGTVPASVTENLEFLCTLKYINPDSDEWSQMLQDVIVRHVARASDSAEDTMIKKMLTESIVSTSVSSCGDEPTILRDQAVYVRQGEGDRVVPRPSVTEGGQTALEHIMNNIASGNLLKYIRTQIGRTRLNQASGSSKSSSSSSTTQRPPVSSSSTTKPPLSTSPSSSSTNTTVASPSSEKMSSMVSDIFRSFMTNLSYVRTSVMQRYQSAMTSSYNRLSSAVQTVNSTVVERLSSLP